MLTKLGLLLGVCGLSALAAAAGPQVDVGYAIYEGRHNATSRLNIFKGIRYAAPPTEKRRWQPPVEPAKNRTAVLPAFEYAYHCPWTSTAPFTGNNFTKPPLDKEQIEKNPFFRSVIRGNEDCLFLNVFAPANAKNLPVLVWIHGGGYGIASSDMDLSHIINANNDGFIAVSIEYRLGAFGWLASKDIKRFGALNAGLLDQRFALEWIQSHIHRFGGDPKRVTISGTSAGGGSVMFHGISDRDSLFQQGISASPYMPRHYDYDDPEPTGIYNAFATLAGCPPGSNKTYSDSAVFDCLVKTDSTILQQANAVVGASGLYGTWSFLPVTDGKLIKKAPSRSLLEGKFSGKSLFVGNTAEEAPAYVPKNVTTQQDFDRYIRTNFPRFTDSDVASILQLYPSSSDPVNPNDPLFATLGDRGLTALNQSAYATGQQQRAYNLYAEFTFVCPTYWLSDAYNRQNKPVYKYQFSIPPAYHYADVPAHFGPFGAQPNLSRDFQLELMRLWGNYIIRGDPSDSGRNSRPSQNLVSTWPPYKPSNPVMLNLNTTGGTPGVVRDPFTRLMLRAMVEPGLKNDIKVVNSDTWEGGRRKRCDAIRKFSEKVPY
ncbi:hypothetical protein FQN57_001494 [Myotisia sp. PD_48]|nr:hypothetical protein FQN57_001494 [Myotisia sp. PD_48]